MTTLNRILRWAILLFFLATFGWPFEMARKSWRLAPTIPAHQLPPSGGRSGSARFREDCAPRRATSSPPIPSGWVDIMPHDSFQGWTRVAIPPDKPLDPVSQWKLPKDSGTILCEGDHGHEWLRYDHELANFLLHVEWRFEKREGLKGYNSGVFVRNDLDGRVWHQAQVGTLAFIFGQTLWHGELSPAIDEMWKNPPPEVNPLHPIGEWNTYEIRCDGPKITLFVNDILTGQFGVPEVPQGLFRPGSRGLSNRVSEYQTEELAVAFKGSFKSVARAGGPE